MEEQFPVDAAGGVFKSVGREVTIDVPENVAPADTRIILQQITNSSPAAAGKAYRIFADKALSGPFFVRFSYAGVEDSILLNPTCLAGIAMQDTATGIWALQTNRSVSETDKTFSVSTKGGDFSLVIPVRLTPASSAIRPSEEVQLQLLSNIVIQDGDICDMYGAGKKNIVLTDDYLVDPSRVDRWQLQTIGNGIGSLSPKGNKAVYIASDHEYPDVNPATVLAYLKGVPAPLSAKIFVLPDGLIIFIGSKKYVFKGNVVDLGVNADGSIGMNWEGSTGMGSMHWSRNTMGGFTWNESNTQFLFEPADFSPLQAFQSFYNDGTAVSPGEVRITAAGNVGQIISGTFTIAPAGRTNVESGDGEYLGATKVSGIFNLVRDF